MTAPAARKPAPRSIGTVPLSQLESLGAQRSRQRPIVAKPDIRFGPKRPADRGGSVNPAPAKVRPPAAMRWVCRAGFESVPIDSVPNAEGLQVRVRSSTLRAVTARGQIMASNPEAIGRCASSFRCLGSALHRGCRPLALVRPFAAPAAPEAWGQPPPDPARQRWLTPIPLQAIHSYATPSLASTHGPMHASDAGLTCMNSLCASKYSSMEVQPDSPPPLR